MRILAIGALSFAAAIFAANYILKLTWLVPCAVLCAVFGIALLFLRRKWLRVFTLALLCAALGFVNYRVHFSSTLERAMLFEGETSSFTCKAVEFTYTDDEYNKLEAKVLSGEASGLYARLYDYSGRLADIEPGDVFEVTAKARAADTRYGKEDKSYAADGLSLLLTVKSDVSVLQKGSRTDYIPARINYVITSVVDSVFPKDVSAFAKSLMVGDKSDLYDEDELYVDMSRAGIMHIVAVSGMHIAFLVSFLQLVLGATPRSSLVCLAVTWLFVLVTGAGPAAVRAGVMQTVVLFAPIVRRENDPITAMSAALAIILGINPFAASSVSLQLSFSAFAGILCISDRLYRAMIRAVPERTGESRWFAYVAGSVSSSIGAVIFSTPLVAIYFGYVAVLSPLTNLIVLWAVSMAFGLCYLAAGAAVIWIKAGVVLAAVAAYPLRYIKLAAKLVSKIPFAQVFMCSKIAVLWLVLVYAVIIAAMLVKGRTGKKIAIVFSIFAFSLAGVIVFQQAYYRRGDGYIAVLDVGQGQSIVSFAGDSTVMIDCGGKNTMENAGNTAKAYLSSRGREYVDVLILTHLHDDHANGVVRLMDSIDIGTIILPADGAADNGLMEEIVSKAETKEIELIFLERDSQIRAGKISAVLYAPADAGGVNERCIMTVLSIGEYDMLVTGDAPMAAERELIAEHELGDLELLIVGHHGSKYSCCPELLACAKAETAVISVGYNTYGHPTEETLERIAEYGYNIYRTDELGTVEVYIDNGEEES